MIPPAEIAELWRKHGQGLQLLVRARLYEYQRSDEADDLVQEAFMRLAQQARVPDEPLAWLAKTARNLAIDACRSRRRRRQREQSFAASRSEWFNIEPANAIVADEATRALQNLAVVDREILIAHLWNSLSFRQIAAAFDISSSSANRIYNRAIETMRAALEPSHPDTDQQQNSPLECRASHERF